MVVLRTGNCEGGVAQGQAALADAEGVGQFWLTSDTRLMWDPASPHAVVPTPRRKHDLLRRRDRPGNIGNPGTRFVLASDRLWLRVPDSSIAVLLERMSDGQGISVAPRLDMAVVVTCPHFMCQFK